MKKYKVHKGKQQELSSQDISKYKDFGKLEANYQTTLKTFHKVPLYKSKKGFFLLLLILFVMWLILQNQQKEEPSKQDAPDTEQVDVQEAN